MRSVFNIFVIVIHPTRGMLFLLSSDTAMNPLDIIAVTHCLRFRAFSLRLSLARYSSETM